MLRGTRYLLGQDADRFNGVITTLRTAVRLIVPEIQEVIIPAIWESSTFKDKVGPENETQMWTFKDKGDRDCCLIPEATAIIQHLWNTEWHHTRQQMLVYYVTRCYRYERPQAGRYREFTQFGVEFLGGSQYEPIIYDAQAVLSRLLETVLPSHVWEMHANVKRGLSYYVEDGFEAKCEVLGAQKQVAGGGRYVGGIGFAVGVDRVVLARQITCSSCE